MANAGCINAIGFDGCFLRTLQCLDSSNIGVGVQYTAPNPLDDKRFDYITYTDKCGCQCCLTDENEILIYATQGVIKNLTLTNDDTNERVIVKWTDLFGSNRAKTVVRYKTGSYPSSPTDGTLAVEETTQNQYQTNGYGVNGLTDGITYYFSVFALDGDDIVINVQSSSITPQFFKSKYQRVEYIMRNGSNYAFIDTGRIPNRSKKLNIQMGIRIDSSGYRHCFMANWGDTSVSSSGGCVSIEVNSGSVSSNRVRAYTEPNSTSGSVEFYSSNSISTGSFHSVSLTINGTSGTLVVDSTTTNGSVASANTLNLSELLFIDRAKRWSEFARNHYISYFFAYENDIAVRQMYPCYRKSDNVIGMVDLVNKVFYPNAGSGSFTKGGNVPR